MYAALRGVELMTSSQHLKRVPSSVPRRELNNNGNPPREETRVPDPQVKFRKLFIEGALAAEDALRWAR